MGIGLRIWCGLRNIFDKHKIEDQLSDEVRAYVEMVTDEKIMAGASADEAHRTALAEFGGVEQVKQAVRDHRAGTGFEIVLQDVRFGLRQLRRNQGFTATAILTLGLGIGATTSIFTLVHAVMLQSLPVAHPEQLFRLGKDPQCCVDLGYIEGGDYGIVSTDLYNYLHDHTKGFEELTAIDSAGTFLGVRRLNADAAAQTYFGEYVSGNYFAMFGIRAFAGRALAIGDDKPDSEPVAVMSYRLWKEKYNQDPSVVGGVFSIDEKPFTIVGIAPPGFYGDRLTNLPPDFYLPLATEPLVKGETSLLKKPDVAWLNVIGRVRPANNVSDIEAQMRVALQQWLRSHWSDMSVPERSQLPKQSLNLAPGGAGMTFMRLQYGDWLWILMISAGSALLIVCTNLANLMFVRGMERRPQISLRIALGAKRGRLIRASLVESLLLSTMGGLAGLGVAFLTTRMILHFAFQTTTEVPISATPSMPVLAFTGLISLLTSVLFGIVPAWLATRVDPVEALRGANRSTRRTGSRLRKGLVAAQAAMSVALVSASGLLMVTLHHLEREDLGFDHIRRTVINIDPLLAGYKQGQLDGLYRRIHDSLAAVPGVASVSSALYTPQSGDEWDEIVYVEGKPAPDLNVDNGAGWTRVTSSFFETLGNPIIKGRPIGDEDTDQSRHVAVINQTFARKFFSNEDPIGKHFGKGAIGYAGDYEVVGVAKDARFANYNLDQPVGPFFYLPESQSTMYSLPVAASTELRSHYLHDVVVEMHPGATLSDALVRAKLSSVDPNLPIRQIRSLGQQVASTFDQQRLIARLISFFGLLSLTLAAIGLYGITSYDLTRRTSEIGVRMALGANRRSIFVLILQGASSLTAIGLILGVPLALVSGRLLSSQLYGVNPYDLKVIATAVIVLALSALPAALIPAFRASSISPSEAVRSE